MLSSEPFVESFSMFFGQQYYTISHAQHITLFALSYKFLKNDEIPPLHFAMSNSICTNPSNILELLRKNILRVKKELEMKR